MHIYMLEKKKIYGDKEGGDNTKDNVIMQGIMIISYEMLERHLLFER